MKSYNIGDKVKVNMMTLDKSLDESTKRWCEQRENQILQITKISEESMKNLYYLIDDKGSTNSTPLYYSELIKYISDWDT